MNRKILVLDTTLRDGEQSPGAKLNLDEKIKIAHQLKKLNIDILEAGFPASSQGDFESVKKISKTFSKDFSITALSRAVKSDILSVYESVKYADNPFIHIVLGTSDIHLNDKFKKSKEDILSLGVEAVKYAKTLLPNVQYSTEDASRSEFEYLWNTIEAVVRAGANIINIPDTVGYATPEEFGNLINKINYRLKNLNPKTILSVHCHNDTGLATANTLAAIKNGADKIECTINGIGERAGNTSLEEVVMGLKLRKSYYEADTNINTSEIINTSRLVSNLTGLDVQVNKAITGENAFAHSSGIHQDGLLKSRNVYEIFNPRDIGLEDMAMVLTARSGRHAFKNSLDKFNYKPCSDEEFEKLFSGFLKVADSKKEVYDYDIYRLIKENSSHTINNLYELISYEITSSNLAYKSTIKLKKDDIEYTSEGIGEGTIDSLYNAMRKIINLDLDLKEYKINSTSSGQTAFARVSITLSHKDKIYKGKAVEKDILSSSAIALINAVNSILLN